MQTRWFSVKHVANRYEVSPATVWRWVHRGILPAPVQLSPGCTRWSGEQLDRRDAEREKGEAA